MTARPRAIFFGSGSFAVPSLELVAASPEVELGAVVTAPARPAGRRRLAGLSPVAAKARALGRPILMPDRLRDAATTDALAALRPDLIVLADYGRLVPPAILDLPRHGALNLHPSLLPRWRGAAPIAAAILAGDAETGVTLMRMDAGLDTGPLVAQAHERLDGSETSPDLETRLAARAAALLALNLGPWLRGERVAIDQPAEGATMTRPLRREDGRLDPLRPAVALERQVRAYQPWPGSYLETALGRILVWEAEVAGSGDEDGPPGRLLEDAKGLALGTVAGRLRLRVVQPAGGRRMSSAELRRGRPGLVGTLIR